MPLPPATVEVGEATPGCSRPRRAWHHPNYLTERPAEGINVVSDILEYCTRKYGTKDAFGWRDIVAVHEEVKQVPKVVNGKKVMEDKTWQYYELSDFKYLSFVQMSERVHDVAKGLIEVGFKPKDIFNIYAATSLEWRLLFESCMLINITVATAYDSLGEPGLLHALNEPECVGIFTNPELIPTLNNIISQATSVRVVIYDGQPKESDLEKLRSYRDTLKVYSLNEIQALGKGKPEPNCLPTPEDAACIMYTSGTTGAPKGVVLKHKHIVAVAGGVKDLLEDELRSTDTYLAFLPLAHILEMVVELTLTFYGFCTGFGRIKTLTDNSVRKCYGDIRTYKPTIMAGVPTIWEGIRKSILHKVQEGGAVKKALFHGSLNVKRANVPVLSNIAEKLVFSKIKEITGGRLRFVLSGGAPINQDTQEFLNIALVCYGLTETSAASVVMHPKYYSPGPIGVVSPCLEIKLLDHPSAGYLHTNNPPQGEVLMRGNSVTEGYFKRPDLNSDRSIFTEDGWFRTGDIGQWNADGTLSIIDRIKNLVKLQGGEYVALERLESVYKSCTLVANICVHAHSEAKQPIAIIYPNEAHLRQTLDSSERYAGLTDKSLAELCGDSEISSLVLKECLAIAKKSGFKPIELLQGVILVADEWTPQSGLVTAAQKLQRKKIEEKYKEQINVLRFSFPIPELFENI
ncbi:hypothetical protein Clacol_005587 [Clathrus columnatus]|uniref:AMP-dependent synthetase/ligase domain-containing protein n=1 Tax=Clathrus columnatus TaxID=1419009 RepID=A0AAV5AAK2_9AGAM|nr:hypothetical protein Clacol_005587 [Clathrus columnatus]